MADFASLLPANATPMERALEAVGAARRPLPAALIKSVWSPEDCPADLLDTLANMLSVDYWDGAWDEARKRAWIRQALPLHRIKGTLAALRAYLAQADGEIVRVVRPPEGLALAPNQSIEDHDAWLRSLPQLRIYPPRIETAGLPLFAVDLGGLDCDALAADFTPAETARRAVIWEDGVETPVGLDDREGLARLVVSPRQPLGPLWALDCAGGALAADDDVAPIYVLGFDDGLTLPSPARPGRRLQMVRPSYVSDLIVADCVFGDGAALDCDWLADDLTARIYYRVPWLRPQEATAGSLGAIYGALDLTRLDMAPRTAELVCSLPGVAPPLGWSIEVDGLDCAAAWETDEAPIWRACDALSAAKRGTDKIVLNTNLSRPLVAGAPLYAGETYHAGEWTRS